MTLIVVLAGIGLSTYSTSVTRAKEAVLRENLFRMRDSIDQFYADKGRVPARSHVARHRRLHAADSKDPFTESADTWQIVMSEPDPAIPNAVPGVFDVKSGAQASASTARRTRTSSSRVALEARTQFAADQRQRPEHRLAESSRIDADRSFQSIAQPAT